MLERAPCRAGMPAGRVAGYGLAPGGGRNTEIQQALQSTTMCAASLVGRPVWYDRNCCVPYRKPRRHAMSWQRTAHFPPPPPLGVPDWEKAEKRPVSWGRPGQRGKRMNTQRARWEKRIRAGRKGDPAECFMGPDWFMCSALCTPSPASTISMRSHWLVRWALRRSTPGRFSANGPSATFWTAPAAFPQNFVKTACHSYSRSANPLWTPFRADKEVRTGFS